MTQIYNWVIETEIGNMMAICQDNAIKALSLMDKTKYAVQVPQNSILKKTEIMADLEKWLGCYFKGKNMGISFDIKPDGTEFQKKVWNELLKIPYGKVVTYGYIAGVIGEREKRRMSAQAVGQAVGHNHILILIPCHRVIGYDGSLTGFGAGLDIKRRLLSLEGYKEIFA